MVSFNKERALYEASPLRYQMKHLYLAAIFAIEGMEQASESAPTVG
jgi:hypothetical protein